MFNFIVNNINNLEEDKNKDEALNEGAKTSLEKDSAEADGCIYEAEKQENFSADKVLFDTNRESVSSESTHSNSKISDHSLNSSNHNRNRSSEKISYPVSLQTWSTNPLLESISNKVQKGVNSEVSPEKALILEKSICLKQNIVETPAIKWNRNPGDNAMKTTRNAAPLGSTIVSLKAIKSSLSDQTLMKPPNSIRLRGANRSPLTLELEDELEHGDLSRVKRQGAANSHSYEGTNLNKSFC